MSKFMKLNRSFKEDAATQLARRKDWDATIDADPSATVPLGMMACPCCRHATLSVSLTEARESFVRSVAECMPEPALDYVRLNIVARRAG